MKIIAHRIAYAAALVAGVGAAPAWGEAGARWLAPAEAIRTGEPVEVVCRVSWPRGDAVGGVLPVEGPRLDWGRLTLSRTISAVNADGAHFDQVYELTAGSPGSFRLPAIEIPYYEEGELPSVDSPLVQSDSITIEVRAPNRAMSYGLFAAGVAAVVIGGLVVLRTRRRPTRVGAADPAIDVAGARAAYTRAKAGRIEGDYYGCYRALCDAVGALGPAYAALGAELQGRAEAAGYGGARPDDTALDSDFRAVKRALQDAAPEGGAAFDTTANQPEVREL